MMAEHFDTHHYLIGYRLYKYNQHLEQHQLEKDKQELAQLIIAMQQFISED